MTQNKKSGFRFFSLDFADKKNYTDELRANAYSDLKGRRAEACNIKYSKEKEY